MPERQRGPTDTDKKSLRNGDAANSRLASLDVGGSSGEDHFNEEQPRVPKGHPDGGQWTRGGFAGRVMGSRSIVAASRKRPGLEAECEDQYRRDIFHCNMVGSPACYSQAMLRYSNCLAGRQIPPLNY